MQQSLVTFTLVCVGSVAWAADDQSFAGTWSTTYGRMILTEQNGVLSGNYNNNGITGTQSGRQLNFTYSEPNVNGEGVFEMAADGQSFTGKWRPNGTSSWSNWTGRRVLENIRPAHPGMPGEVPDEPKPVVYRYGNLPQGLPPYFVEGDTDRDGQIGLYEWVKCWGVSEAKLAEFKSLDLNGDGLLTAEEYLRAQKMRPKPNVENAMPSASRPLDRRPEMSPRENIVTPEPQPSVQNLKDIRRAPDVKR